jgi:hypothetical protein
MADKIEITCAVCGLHTIHVPAREGIYIIKCPNKTSFLARKFTKITVHKNGSVDAQISYADGRTQ